MPDETQVQAPQETPTARPVTPDPVWHLLFDRLDAQDENIKRGVENTVVIAKEQERLREHVNDEQGKLVVLIEKKVEKGQSLNDAFNELRHNRHAQALLAAVVVAMAPVVIANWTALVESVRALFS